MSKTIIGLLAIVTLVSVIGISFTSADASGKPTTEISSKDVLGVPYVDVCGVDNAKANMYFETAITTWPDKDMERFVVITTGELFDENENTIGELKGKETRQGHTDEHGVFMVKITITIHCFDGGMEKFYIIHNIMRN